MQFFVFALYMNPHVGPKSFVHDFCLQVMKPPVIYLATLGPLL